MIRRDIGAIMRSQSAVLVYAGVGVSILWTLAYLIWGWAGVEIAAAAIALIICVLWAIAVWRGGE